MHRKPLIAKEPECSSTPIPRAKDGLEPPVAEANIHLKRERVVANGHYADSDPEMIIRVAPSQSESLLWKWLSLEKVVNLWLPLILNKWVLGIAGYIIAGILAFYANWEPAKKADLDTAKSVIAQIQTDVGTLKTDVGALKTDSAQNQKSIQTSFDALAKKIDAALSPDPSATRRRVVAKKPKKLSIFQ